MENLDIPQIKLENAQEEELKPKKSLVEPLNLEGETNSEVPKKETMKNIKFNKFKNVNWKKAGLGIGGILGLLVAVMVFLLVIPGFNLYNKGKALANSAQSLQDTVKLQDIAKIRTQLDVVEKDLISFQSAQKPLVWLRLIPILNAYWGDGEAAVNAGVIGIEAAKITLVTVEPYADIIGFSGDPSKKATSGEESANDRIEFIIQTISDISPKLDEIAQKANLAKVELEKIDPNRYPEEFRGIKLREKMKRILDLSSEATAAISQSKPILQMAPYFLGIDEPRKYLVLFQNDKELRPTGGFLTAYSIMNVDKGKAKPVSSSDIYSLDAKYIPSVEAPQELRSYLKGPYTISKNYFLRDMNWNPDFKESMKLFTEEAKSAGLPEVDGIIAVDTSVLVKILDVLGEIGVPGFGNFSTKNDPRCDCPQVIYELEDFADVEGPVVWSENEPGKIVFAPKNYGKNRKEIVGPLMNSVLSNALGQPMSKIPSLFEAGWESIMEKHVLMYMFDAKAQEAVEAFNLAGQIRQTEGDYLLIADANLGGRKSNLYVTSEVHQEVKVNRDKSIEKTLEITYKNPKPHDGWLNSVLPNWTRIYVPKGSELISVDGFEDKGETYEESGKTVFSGGFKLRPEGISKITLKYKIPALKNNDYNLLVQKQPGTNSPLYTIKVVNSKQEEETFLLTDKEFKFKI